MHAAPRPTTSAKNPGPTGDRPDLAGLGRTGPCARCMPFGESQRENEVRRSRASRRLPEPESPLAFAPGFEPAFAPRQVSEAERSDQSTHAKGRTRPRTCRLSAPGLKSFAQEQSLTAIGTHRHQGQGQLGRLHDPVEIGSNRRREILQRRSAA